MILILMGVCGCGKTTVGRALAAHLHFPFLDADDFHPASNVDKMARGIALTDADRWPWLDRLAAELAARDDRSDCAVLACSALKRAYRNRIEARGARDVRWVFLKGDAATIESRLSLRDGHYMPASLLQSQFAALEEPDDAIVVDIAQPTETQVTTIVAHLLAARERGSNGSASMPARDERQAMSGKP